MHDSYSCSVVVVTQLNLIGVNLSKKILNFCWPEPQSEKKKKEREKKNESLRGNILIPIFMVSQSVKP